MPPVKWTEWGMCTAPDFPGGERNSVQKEASSVEEENVQEINLGCLSVQFKWAVAQPGMAVA